LVVFVSFIQILLSKNEEAGEAIKKLEEQLADFKQQEKKAVEDMKGPGKGRPLCRLTHSGAKEYAAMANVLLTG
jgi:hypothetical protein